MPVYPIHDSARKGDWKLCRQYVKSGYYGDPQKTVNSVLKHSGMRPLHWAAQYGHAPCCKYLLEQGAEILAVNHKGATAATLAAKSSNSIAVLEVLRPYIQTAELRVTQAELQRLQKELHGLHGRLASTKQAQQALQREERKAAHAGLLSLRAVQGDLQTVRGSLMEVQREQHLQMQHLQRDLAAQQGQINHAKQSLIVVTSGAVLVIGLWCTDLPPLVILVAAVALSCLLAERKDVQALYASQMSNTTLAVSWIMDNAKDMDPADDSTVG